MNAEPLLADNDARLAEHRWRVAVARPAGNAGRLAAAEVLTQLRARGSQADEVETGRSVSSLAGRTLPERTGAARPYDLVLAVGDLSPTVMALGVSEGVPVAHVPLAPSDTVAGAVIDALVAGDVDLLPLLDVTVDGEHRFTGGSVAIAADGDGQDVLVAWDHGSSHGELRTPGCRIDPPAEAAGAARLEPSAAEPIEIERVRIDAGDATVRVAIDRRTRRGRRITVASLPEGLRVLRLPHPEA